MLILDFDAYKRREKWVGFVDDFILVFVLMVLLSRSSDLCNSSMGSSSRAVAA